MESSSQDGAGRPNLSSKFRGLLKRELPLWVAEGYLSPEASGRLADRYKLDDLGRESSRLLVSIIFGIGGLLLGGGVLAFVAAHWEALPVPVKVALLFAALFGFYGAGWYLWQERNMERLGRSLVFTGCLVFGANIGLMAQVFHIRSEWYNGFLAWSVGALAMAWAVRSPLAGLLALATSFTWFAGYFSHHHDLAQVYVPLVLLALVPLALRAGSRALFTLTVLVSMLSFSILTGETTHSTQPILLGLVASGFCLWAAGFGFRPGSIWERFAPASRVTGIALLAGAAYFYSFLDLWKETPEYSSRYSFDLSTHAPWWVLGILAASLAGGWFFLKSLDALRATGKPGFLTWGTVASALLLAIPGVAFLNGSPTLGGIGAASANLSCLFLGAVAVISGLAQERRAHFWLGTIFLVLVILSRFLEYETGLLLKSLAFISCGALLIYAGIRYEAFLKRKGAGRV